MTIMSASGNSSNDEPEAGIESDGSESDQEQHSDDVNGATNAGWADSISKILSTTKPKGKKTVILAKARKITDVKKPKPVDPGFSIDGEVTEQKTDLEQLLDRLEPDVEPPKKKRKDLPKLRVKPNILEKDRERTLSKIATKGVVQLFNAVRNQQKDIDKQLEEAGPLERKRENVLRNVDKRAFLDVLMGEKSEIVKNTAAKSATVNDKTWNVLRDDFMMGAKLKDWDKELETEDLEEECSVE